MPKISILIPHYNNAETIEKCLESCLAQGENRTQEIIVVDDGSETKQFEFLQSLSRKTNKLKVYKNPKKGANHARNYAFEQSTGDFVQWLDADDVLLPGKFETQLRFFAQHPKTDIVYSDWRYDFYQHKQFTHSEAHTARSYPDYLLELLKDNWQPCHSYLLRRKIAQKLHETKGWNPHTRVAQDREYFTMAGILGAQFGYVGGEFAVYNRWGGSRNISTVQFRQRLAWNLESVYRYLKNIDHSENLSSERKKKYKKLLHTEILVSCFYNPALKIRQRIPFSHILWKRIHWKMRFFITFIYFWQHIQLKRS